MSTVQPRRGTTRTTQSARDRAATLRREAEAEERRRRRGRKAAAVGGAAVLAAGVIAVVTLTRDTGAGTPEIHDLSAFSGLGARSMPPWPAPTQHVADRVHAAGLPLGPEATVEHYHAHLDVIVDGQPVAVPAGIGIDTQAEELSPLHTHEADGVIHIESGQKGQTFTLGQVFTEWNVRLTPTRIGALHDNAGRTLTVYVDGTPADGNPALIRLRPHQEIAVVFGPRGQHVDVPDSYSFQPGE